MKTNLSTYPGNDHHDEGGMWSPARSEANNNTINYY